MNAGTPAYLVFYGDMVRKKNVFGPVMHSFAATALVNLLCNLRHTRILPG
jgi:ammonia channel protein AmtB